MTTDASAYRMNLTSDELAKFRTKSPHPVPAGFVTVNDTSTGKTLAKFMVPAGFQPLEWIMSWHSGPIFIKRMREFILQDLGISYIRYLDETKHEPN